MGLFDWLLGSKSGDAAGFSADTKSRFEAAISKRGGHILSWKGTIASAQVAGETHQYDLINLCQTVSRQGRTVTDNDISTHLDKLDEINQRHSQQEDLSKVRHLLRPRITSQQLADSQPRLCRLDFVPGHLVCTLTIDWGDTASYVTDTLLKSWNVPFEEVFKIGVEQLKAATSREHFHVIEDVDGILVNDCKDGIASSRCLILDDMFPEAIPEQGILFSVPNNEILLVHVVNGKASGAVPILLQNVTAELYQTQQHPLAVDVFWRRRNEVHRLNILVMQSPSGELSINVISAGITEEFLKLTGAVTT